MAVAFPVYSALHQPVPAVLKNIAAEDVPVLKTNITQLINQANLMQNNASNRVNSAQSSVFRSSYMHLSPAGTWITAFGTLLITTITSWDENTAGTKAGQVIALTGMVVTALHTGIVYWRNRRQTSLVESRTERFVHLQTIFNSLEFLNQSRKMAKQCLKTDPPANLSLIFPIFETYMRGLRAGVVPNDLSVEWAEVGRIIRLPDGDEGHEQMPIHVTGRILPMIRHYATELNQQLISLGYTPPQQAAPQNAAQQPLQIIIENEDN